MQNQTRDITKPLRFKRDFLLEYLCKAPVALAVERAQECALFARKDVFPPVVDYGCGDGLFASVLFADKIDAGIDISKEDLLGAEKTRLYRKLYDSNRVDAGIKTGSVNTVICNSVLEHVEDLGAELSRIHRMLSGDGWAYVTVPSEKYETHTILHSFLASLGFHGSAQASRRCFNKFWRHRHCYPRQEWERRFSQAGFRVMESHRYAPKKMCLLGNLFLPFAAPAIITKRFFGRWILIEPLRRAYIKGLYRALKKELGQSNSEGALFFFALQKRHAA